MFNGVTTEHKFFVDFLSGDEVIVAWPSNLVHAGAKSCYQSSGVVVYVCDKFLVLRCRKGYNFCVSRADVIEGAVVKLKAAKGSSKVA
jgi:hypothetical protein